MCFSFSEALPGEREKFEPIGWVDEHDRSERNGDGGEKGGEARLDGLGTDRNGSGRRQRMERGGEVN